MVDNRTAVDVGSGTSVAGAGIPALGVCVGGLDGTGAEALAVDSAGAVVAIPLPMVVVGGRVSVTGRATGVGAVAGAAMADRSNTRAMTRMAPPIAMPIQGLP